MSARAEKAAIAVRMRAEGATQREIAAALGVSVSYASMLYGDPDRSREVARKRSYGGVCEDCGARTDGSNGRALAPKRCSPCQHAWEIATKTWTREAVILAIQEWARKHGRPPLANDWLHADPKGRYPCRGSVYQSTGNAGSPFPTWNEGIRAAGFQPYDRGRYPRAGEAGLGATGRRALAALRASARPLGLKEIAEAAGCAYNCEWNMMQALLRRGLAARVGWGRYAAAEHVEERIAA